MIFFGTDFRSGIGTFFVILLCSTVLATYFSLSSTWYLASSFSKVSLDGTSGSAQATRYEKHDHCTDHFYHPIYNQRRLYERITYKCHIQLPSAAELSQHPYKNWPTTRLVAYYNIFKFLQSRLLSSKISDVLDFGGSKYLKPFNKALNITLTKHPGVDIHQTNFPDNTFDIVSADQVLEHVIYPPIAMLELKRILKPGGIAILTSVSFNPLHESSTFHDIWRFMKKGFLVLSLPFDGGIKLCGTWGTKNFTTTRALLGIGTSKERHTLEENKASLVSSNDLSIPSLVWMVIEN